MRNGRWTRVPGTPAFLTVVLLVALVLLGNTTAVFGELGCSPCTCSGNGTCNGCQTGWTDGFGFSVKVVNSPFYNFCEVGGGDSLCIRQEVTCVVLPVGTIIYSDNTCSTPWGVSSDPLTVKATGCTP
jgi:hypothetical protein